MRKAAEAGREILKRILILLVRGYKNFYFTDHAGKMQVLSYLLYVFYSGG